MLGEDDLAVSKIIPVQMDGTTGPVMVVPGLASEEDMMTAASVADNGQETEGLAYFTNPQGVFNKNSGFWAVPRDRVWNGRYRAPTKKERPKATAAPESRPEEKRQLGQTERRAKVMLTTIGDDESSSEKSDVP
ncbi:unnamed protein product [Phytophthora fragariaefolia]|uniref:Unnamed protein product n=1 Tax=Phytophthora fragariaefolia TaxID=1490495 RepID=A0A9W7CYU1_9STRA|nr:unnamed protein product [Phytophthora fragariaefolia]